MTCLWFFRGTIEDIIGRGGMTAAAAVAVAATGFPVADAAGFFNDGGARFKRVVAFSAGREHIVIARFNFRRNRFL